MITETGDDWGEFQFSQNVAILQLEGGRVLLYKKLSQFRRFTPIFLPEFPQHIIIITRMRRDDGLRQAGDGMCWAELCVPYLVNTIVIFAFRHFASPLEAAAL